MFLRIFCNNIWLECRESERSDLIDKREMGELSSMCLTYNVDISRRILDIWEEWNTRVSMIGIKSIIKKNLKLNYKNHIECYDYREPLILAKRFKMIKRIKPSDSIIDELEGNGYLGLRAIKYRGID